MTTPPSNRRRFLGLMTAGMGSLASGGIRSAAAQVPVGAITLTTLPARRDVVIRRGMGFVPVPELLDAGLPADSIGMSVDVSCQTCADPFQMMRIVLGIARNRARDAKRLTARQVLRMSVTGPASRCGGRSGNRRVGLKRFETCMFSRYYRARIRRRRP